MAPAGTPAPTVDALAAAFNTAIAAPDMQRKFLSFGVAAHPESLPALKARISGDLGTWTRVVKEAGIRAE